ncbi:MAG: aldo/keto reductase [Clostridia bacterium]
MELRKLGNSGIEVSTIAIGCWPFGGGTYWGEQSQDDVNKVVAGALDSGINFFDVAESYNGGASEESLGLALKGGLREKAVVLSKTNPSRFTLDDTYQAQFDSRLDAMLKRLQMEYLDVLMVHWPNPEFARTEALLRAIEGAVESGKVRTIGISNFGPIQMKEIIDAGLTKYVSVNELQYNLVSRAIETEILPICIENNFSVMTYCTLQQGVLTGKYATPDEVPYNQAHSRHFQEFRGNGTSGHSEAGAEKEIFELLAKMKGMASDLGISMAELSLAWALARPGITTAIAGCRNLDQLAMNRKAADIKLSPEVIATLNDWSTPAFVRLGDCADFFKNREDTRIW